MWKCERLWNLISREPMILCVFVLNNWWNQTWVQYNNVLRRRSVRKYIYIHICSFMFKILKFTTCTSVYLFLTPLKAFNSTQLHPPRQAFRTWKKKSSQQPTTNNNQRRTTNEPSRKWVIYFQGGGWCAPSGLAHLDGYSILDAEGEVVTHGNPEISTKGKGYIYI